MFTFNVSLFKKKKVKPKIQVSDVNFDPPGRGIAIQQCEIKKYIENEDSDYPQNRRITIASYGFGRNTVLRRKPKECGRKMGWVLLSSNVPPATHDGCLVT